MALRGPRARRKWVGGPSGSSSLTQIGRWAEAPWIPANGGARGATSNTGRASRQRGIESPARISRIVSGTMGHHRRWITGVGKRNDASGEPEIDSRRSEHGVDHGSTLRPMARAKEQ
uniref:Uncharacterized protein n=1 Tax=Leersia perrieri TaxID=77586 RepID=A0A0D9V531_9ORYZ